MIYLRNKIFSYVLSKLFYFINFKFAPLKRVIILCFLVKNLTIEWSYIRHLVFNVWGIYLLFSYSDVLFLPSQILHFLFVFLYFINVNRFMKIPDLWQFPLSFFQSHGLFLLELIFHLMKQMLFADEFFDFLCWFLVLQLTLLHALFDFG